jgi:hypothetical protein
MGNHQVLLALAPLATMEEANEAMPRALREAQRPHCPW